MSRPSRRDRSRATPVGGAATAVASAWSGPPTQAGPQLDRFRALLASGEPVLADGAMGTMLFAAGLASGDPPEVWNLAHPDVVRGVHRGYLDAGARMTVVEQNQRTGTAALAELRGKPVHLTWLEEHVIEIPGSS